LAVTVNDDMPFLVDSTTDELTRRGWSVHMLIHPVLRVRRDADGRLLDLFAPDAAPADAAKESVMFVAFDEQTDTAVLGDVERSLAGVLAAGNRAMIKPSEFTPVTSALMKELIEASFDETEIAVITGGTEVGKAFSELPFDHLVFTGGTGIGRHVMAAAAKNLVPLTLELGGKSPTIISRTADIGLATERIAMGKMMNAGQI
jgi:NAD-specific glutamate dehydrogenase